MKRVLDEMFEAYKLGLSKEEYAAKLAPLLATLTEEELQEVGAYHAAESLRLQGIAASQGRIAESILDKTRIPN